MRIRKAVITVALSAAAIGGTAASPALATAASAGTPYVGHNVGGGLLTRQSLHVGQTVNLVGTTSGRISSYRVTAAHRDAGVDYVTVWPRLQAGNGNLVLFTTSN